MITIQSGMLLALGFLSAILLGLLVAPAIWARAVRLTTKRLKDTIPLSEMEIEADRDRIRAEYAIKMHKLESLVEQVKLAGARQQIEINRRDARVNMLEADLERLTAGYEEAQNARRVLEQTIADRLPRVESRLTDAKKLLFTREREIGELTRTTERQARALADANAASSQHQQEIEQLTTSLARSTLAAGQVDDAALRAEIDALRAKTREQAQLLARMQSLAGRSPADAAGEPTAAAASGAALAVPLEMQRQLQDLKARNDDQAGEIVRLKAAIAVFEGDPDAEGKGAQRESRVALKARLQSIEAQSSQQAEIIAKLRNELAAANERLARQAAHYTGELKRLGGGTPAPDGARRSSAMQRTSLADRVANGRAAGDTEPADPAAVPEKVERELAEPAPSSTAAVPGEASGPGPGRGRLVDRIASLSRSS